MKLAVAQGLSPRLMAPRTFERNQHEESRHLPVALAGAIVLASTALLFGGNTAPGNIRSGSGGVRIVPKAGFPAGLRSNES